VIEPAEPQAAPDAEAAPASEAKKPKRKKLGLKF
jgi:hypothetical protein